MDTYLVTGICYPPKPRLALVPKSERMRESQLLNQSFLCIIQGFELFDGFMKDEAGEHKLSTIKLSENHLMFTKVRREESGPEYVLYNFRRKNRIWVGTYCDLRGGRGNPIEGTCRCFVNRSVEDLFSPPYEL